MASESTFNLSELSQEHIDEYVASTADFWPAYHAGLQAPYAIYKQYRNMGAEEYYALCARSDADKAAVTVLQDFPVLKGEFPVAMANGDILTNYRYVVTEVGSATNIPLHCLTHFDIQSSASDTRNDLMIKYIRGGSEQTVRLDEWIKDEIVRAVRNAAEFDDLSDVQKAILETSTYNIKRKHPSLNVPMIEMWSVPAGPKEGCFEGMGCYKLPIPEQHKEMLKRVDKMME